MESERKRVCRFCLTICKSGFEAIEEATQQLLIYLLLNLDLTVSEEPVACDSCIKNLRKCFKFKTNCIEFSIKNEVKKLVAPIIYQSDGFNVSTFSLCNKTATCIFCMKLVKKDICLFSKIEDRHMMSMVNKYFPELDLNLTEEFVTCLPCCKSLERHYTFISNCMDVEEKIREYCHVEGTNSNGQVLLNNLLHFTSKSTLQKNLNSSFNTIKIERDCFEEGKIEEYEIRRLENGNLMEMEEEFDLMVEDNEIEVEQSDCKRFRHNGVSSQHPAAKPVVYNYEISEHQMKFNDNNLSLDTSHNKSNSELTVYRCEICGYQNIYKSKIKNHMLTHKTISEVALYNCTVCEYQTKYKCGLNQHMLIHKNISEVVTVHRCGMCKFETQYEKRIKRHMLTHENISEMTLHKCAICKFQTKKKGCLSRHNMLKHDNVSGMVINHKCRICKFETKSKNSLNRHMLIHKNIFLYKCTLCQYVTRREVWLKKHILKHERSSGL